MRHSASLALLVGVICGFSSTAAAQHPGIYTIVSELRQQSHADALTIKDVYRPMIDTALFADRDHLRRALESGELVPLSSLELQHLQPRLSGESPIAQKDLEHQALYVALRPAAMGMLIDITRRVAHGPLEITSMVRTSEYQNALMRGNRNANTDVPTHAMGYAVDIGLKFASEQTAKELRRVLDDMRAAGDIYFIAEANQLTFHMVPVPSRIPHFEALYRETISTAKTQATPVEAPSAPLPDPEPAPATSRFANLWNWIQSLFD